MAITEAIKTALGADLAAQVETALKGRGKDGKDIDLVIGNDGSFVPAHKYEDEKTRANNAEKALKSAADSLKAIGGGGDTTKIVEDLQKVKGDIDILQQNHQKEITSIRKNSALRAALSGKVHDPADIISLLDLEKIDVDDNGTIKSNLDDMLKPIKETKGYLFTEEGGSNVVGATPAGSGTGTPPPVRTAGPVVM